MLKGLGNLANLGSMLKQAQQVGSRLQEISAQLRTKRAVGTSGAGLVEVEVNGLGEVLHVRIDPDLFAKGDREMIEDLIPAAANQAQEKAKQLHAQAMQGLAAGMDIPGLGEALANLSGGDEPDQGDQ